MSTTNEFRNSPQFGDRYRVRELLGKGARGEVYLAHDLLLFNTQVAIKRLSKYSKPEHRESFLKEIIINRGISSPYVVRIYEAGDDLEKIPFYVMEFLAGGSLRERITHDNFPLNKSLALALQILEGLALIHEAGILHYDIKSSNILLTEDDVPKLADFGVPPQSNNEESFHVYGSAHYLSPEGWKGEKYGVSGDLYALGVVFYEMLTGILPYDGLTQAELMYKHLEQEPVPPYELSDDIPEWISDFVVKLIAKDPYDRFPSARSCQEYLIDGMTSPRQFVAEPTPNEVEVQEARREQTDKEILELLRPADLAETLTDTKLEAQPSSSLHYPDNLITTVCEVTGRPSGEDKRGYLQLLLYTLGYKLSSIERIAVALVLTFFSWWLLLPPGIWIAQNALFLTVSSRSWLLYGLAVLIPTVMIVHFMALPFTLAVMLRHNMRSAFLVWRWILVSGCIASLLFNGLFLYSLQRANSRIGRAEFESEQLHSVLQSSMKNLVEVVLLEPQGTLYKSDNGVHAPLLTIDPAGELQYRVAYYVIMALLVFATSATMRAYFWRHSQAWLVWLDVLSVLGTFILSASGLIVVPWIEEHLTKMRYVADLHSFSLIFSLPYVVWFITTWALVIVSQGVICWVCNVKEEGAPVENQREPQQELKLNS